ncbi:MAG: hypothetical protein Udaeo2_03870 [Candidatus Udaeobacter sp.]|jgi:Fe-S oxidoreductase|nr:MAG: hypothetical protein Udaeo2_03870 [Candidatus Udaeobacter sp.]
MAGAFGALAEKYDLSVQVAQDLIDKLENQGRETQIIASGTSCRHQIRDLTNIQPKAYGRGTRRSAAVAVVRQLQCGRRVSVIDDG